MKKIGNAEVLPETQQKKRRREKQKSTCKIHILKRAARKKKNEHARKPDIREKKIRIGFRVKKKYV